LSRVPCPERQRTLCAWSAFWAAAIFSIVNPTIARAQTAPMSPYPGATPTYAPPAPPPLETGGLTPPPASPRPEAENQTLERLERAEREDAGRGLEFVWLDVESGYEYIALSGIASNGLVDGQVIEDSGSALSVGAAAGVRLVFITLGGRFRMAKAGDWDLWTLNAEVGLHVPFGALEPSFTLGAGYASLGAFDTDSVQPGTASGFDVRLGAGLDWYINPLLSLGAKATLELLSLERAAAPQPGTEDPAQVYARDGDGTGYGVTISAGLGLHF